MSNKKDLAKTVILFLLCTPTAMLFNESEHLWVNAIGMTWAILLMITLKYTKGGRSLTKATMRVGERYFK